MWILSKIITNHPTEKDLPTQHIFHKFWQTLVLQTQMRKHNKAEEIHGVAKKKAWPQTHHGPCWPAAMQTAFARVLLEKLQQPYYSILGKNLCFLVLTRLLFTTVSAEVVREGCLAEGNETALEDSNTHGSAPAAPDDSWPGPGKYWLLFASDLIIYLTGMLGRSVNTCI